jgi:hypothetical protein
MTPEKFVSDPSSNNIDLNKKPDPYQKEASPPITIPFWTENPNILFDPVHITEFYPIDTMSYDQKLNAITRTILLFTLLGLFFTRSFRVLCIGLLTIGVIYLMHYYHELENAKVDSKKKTTAVKEGFSGPAAEFYQKTGISVPDNVFQAPDSHNPFSNVLMTDYEDQPNKRPAPPAFNKNISDQILKQAKKAVSESNPGQPDIADKLFRDLGEELAFEQSMRQFNSTPGTTIPNDQAAFAEFCYGSMVSCKEGNAFACARNLSHYTNY